MSDHDSGSDLLNDLAHQFAERYRQGERPTLTEYTEKYPSLAAQIRELFPALVMMEEFGTLAGRPASAHAASGAELPRELGEFRVLREIGRGGMGVVYEAIQRSLGRHVALKVLPLRSVSSPTHLERFEREARAAARLHHSNIVPVFGTGVHDGMHYYAMQYIEGQALDRVLVDVRRLRAGYPAPTPKPTTAGIAQSLLTDARPAPSVDATAAVGKGDSGSSGTMADGRSNDLGQGRAVPSSELTASSEGRYHIGVARIGVQVAEALAYAHGQGIVHRDIKPSNLLLDVHGVVWITDFGLVKDEESSNLTNPGDIVGTLRYMAPERFEDQGDARCDLYSLGATLYEMLALRPAFLGDQRGKLIDRLRHEEPPRLRDLDPRIPRDLETVVLKAMAKEPGRRYQTANELAEDLRRFLADRPVLARRSTAPERFWRWCRRNPVVATLSASVVALLLVMLINSLVSNFRLHEHLQRAERAEKEKTDKLWDSYLASAQASHWSGRPGRRFDGLDAVRHAAAIRSDLRLRNEAIALLTLPDVRVVREVPQGMPSGTAALTFDPDMEHYARSDLKGNISVRRVADDQEVANLPGPGGHAYQMKFSPDGRFLSAYYAPNPGKLWDWRRGKVILEDVSDDFSPDGKRIAHFDREGWLTLFDLRSGEVVKRVQIDELTPRGYRHRFHPGGKMLVYGSLGKPRIKILDLDTWKVTHTLDVAEPAFMEWQMGGTLLALGRDEQISVWDTRTWTQQVVLNAPDTRTTTGSFSPRDDLLATVGWDDRLRLWNPTTGRELFSLPGSNQPPQFSRDGRYLAMTVLGTNLQLREVAWSREYQVLRTPRESSYGTWATDFSPDGALLATAGAGGARIWNVATGRDIADLPTGICSGVVFDADGSLFARTEAGLERWPFRVDAETLTIGPRERIVPLERNNLYGTLRPAAGKLAANLRAEKVVAIFDPRKPDDIVKLPGHTGSTNDLAVSPDGRWVAATTWWDQPDKLRVSDVNTRKVVWTYPVKTPGTFSPDSRWLVTGGDACRIWETGTWRLERTISSAPEIGSVVYAAFAPDGIVLAISYNSRVMRLVDSRTGDELATLPAHDLPAIDRLFFSPDGSRLGGVTDVVGVQLWDLRRLRAELADLHLDWELPPYPPESARVLPIKIRIVP
jgi:serine/threonine protein kinase/WD40 repeat protein